MADTYLSYYVPHEEFTIAERTEQVHVTATIQIPVLHFIETISKNIQQLENNQEHFVRHSNLISLVYSLLF